VEFPKIQANLIFFKKNLRIKIILLESPTEIIQGLGVKKMPVGGVPIGQRAGKMRDSDEHFPSLPGQAMDFFHGPDYILQVFQDIQAINPVKFVRLKRVREPIQVVNDIGLGFWAEIYSHGPRYFSVPTANVQDLHRPLSLRNLRKPFLIILSLDLLGNMLR
jgi:hypothetical protein